MTLPDNTQAYIQQVADSLETGASDEWELAEAVYETGTALDYGLSGALDQGVWARYPDELNGQANCHEVAVRSYLLADELGLEPRYFRTDLGVDHRFIDVAVDGDRVLIDPFHDMFGPVSHYDDTERRVVDNPATQKTRDRTGYVLERSRDELLDEMNGLRQDPVGMLRNRQKIDQFDHAHGPVKDWIQYDDQEQELERIVMQYNDVGFLNPMTRVTYSFMDDGSIASEQVAFSDVSSVGFSSITGEIPIAEWDRGTETYTFDGDYPDRLKEAVVTALDYQDQKGADTLLYTEGDLDVFWERFIDQQRDRWQDHTGFDGRDIWNEYTWLEDQREEDPSRFYRAVDWLRYLEQHERTDLPEDGELEAVLPQYLERHTAILDAVQDADHSTAVPATVSGIQQYIREHDQPDDDTGPDIASFGTAESYTELADTVESVAETGDIAELEPYRPLLAVEPRIREEVNDRLDIESLERLDLDVFDTEEYVAFPDAPYSGQRHWSFDPDTYTLTHTITFDDNLSEYASRMAVTYRFDTIGEVTEKRLEIAESLDAGEEDGEYCLYDASFDALGDITMEDVQEGAVDRLDQILEEPTLHAPEPTPDTDFLEKQPGAVAVYSRFLLPEDDPVMLFDRERSRSLRERMKEEYRQIQGSPYRPIDERSDADAYLDRLEERASLAADIGAMTEEERDELWERVQDDDELGDWEKDMTEQFLDLADRLEPEGTMQIIDEYNTAISSLQNGEKGDVGDAVRDRYPEPADRLREYMKKFCDPFDDVLWTDTYEEEADALVELVADGIQQTIPDAATIAEETEQYDSSVADHIQEINTLLDASVAWERKGPEIDQRCEQLDADHDLSSPAEKTAVTDALEAFQYRLQDRWRYREWRDTVQGVDLVGQFVSARDRIDQVTPRNPVYRQDAQELYEKVSTGS